MKGERYKKERQSGAATPDSVGFGLMEFAESKGDTTEFDTGTATKLLATCRRHLGASHPNVRRAKIDKWADHIRLLRTTDATKEDTIKQVAAWYCKNIGKDFVPEVFSGKSFRAKFPALERAYRRDVVASVDAGPEAIAIAISLATLGWPKGSVKAVPAVVQSSLDAYTHHTAQCHAFVDKLRRDDLSKDYGNERTRLLRLGEHLLLIIPPPAHFIRGWMHEVNRQVSNWDEWGGALAPYAFKPTSHRFHNIGRRWAESYCNDPDRWDRFNEVMTYEMS